MFKSQFINQFKHPTMGEITLEPLTSLNYFAYNMMSLVYKMTTVEMFFYCNSDFKLFYLDSFIHEPHFTFWLYFYCSW